VIAMAALKAPSSSRTISGSPPSQRCTSATADSDTSSRQQSSRRPSFSRSSTPNRRA